jgi:RNA polymerase sigma-54 factor
MAEQYLAQTQQQRLQMVLAPQLRQSLEFLQVPILELRTLVAQELQENPTLEDQPVEAVQLEVEPGGKDDEPEENKELDFKEEFEVLARLDDEWREYFQQNQSYTSYSRDDEARRQFFLDSLCQTESLQEHLMNQLMLSGLGGHRKQIGELLVGSMNDDGYITVDLDDLAVSTGFVLPEIEEMLGIIQEFDPIGVGARDLRECLLLQLNRLGKNDTLAAKVVRDHLSALGARKFGDIARMLKVPVEDIHEVSRLISTLEPKPGRIFTSDATSYVLPEVVVQKHNGEYTVILNDDQVPRLRISRHYRRLMEEPSTSPEVKNYIREKVRAGAFLIKSIDQRQQTISRIAHAIVNVQREFLDHGLSHLRPLTMAEIADELGIHETTVSRAIANKYMQTPQGVFEMKYFFTPGFKTADGQNISNKTIKDAILQLVQNEDPASPLSDQAMVTALKEKGIKVARRTIAKYRDELKILPSHLRKSF